jgi:hypothetical protein
MKEDIGLVVLEHLGHQLDVHILHIDLLHANIRKSEARANRDLGDRPVPVSSCS